jgi:hypothetical protein
MKYQKPKLESFGGFRDLTQVGMVPTPADGQIYGYSNTVCSETLERCQSATTS